MPQKNHDAEFVPFGRVLRDLLIEREITTGMGNPNWSAFSELLENTHYETLRKAVTGERQPTMAVMEDVANAVGVDPGTFVEYRLLEAAREFDPREVGSAQALKALEQWDELHKRRRR